MASPTGACVATELPEASPASGARASMSEKRPIGEIYTDVLEHVEDSPWPGR